MTRYTFNKETYTFDVTSYTFNKETNTFNVTRYTFNKETYTFNVTSYTFNKETYTFNVTRYTFNVSIGLRTRKQRFPIPGMSFELVSAADSRANRDVTAKQACECEEFSKMAAASLFVSLLQAYFSWLDKLANGLSFG